MGKYSKPAHVLRALLISYAVTAVMLLVLAFALYKWKLGQQMMTVGVHAAYMFSCFLGGLSLGKASGSRRFLWGMLGGALYFLILFLMMLISDGGGTPLFGTLVTFLLCALSGGIGGTLG